MRTFNHKNLFLHLTTYNWIRSATEFLVSGMFYGGVAFIVVNIVIVAVRILLELFLKVNNIPFRPLVAWLYNEIGQNLSSYILCTIYIITLCMHMTQ